jgi:hypothetical protein
MDDSELQEILRDINIRLLWLEVLAGAPVSYVDRLFAGEMDARRRAPHEEARRRVEAFRKAEAEAARVGHRGPIDKFVRELKAGESDRHLPGLK